MDKAAVFIDNGYFKQVLASHGTKYLRFDAFSRWVCERINAEWYRTYFYDCMPYQSNPPTQEERERFSRANSFIYSLENLPRFQVRLGKLIKLPNGVFKQKGVDIKLTIDLLKLSLGGMIQKAILVGSDSDFVPVIQEAKNEGIIVFSCFSRNPGCGIHDELYKTCDDEIELTTDILKEIK